MTHSQIHGSPVSKLFRYKVSGEFLRQDSQSFYSFGKIQNVGEKELSEEKNLVFHWRKISYFAFIYIFLLVLLLIFSNWNSCCLQNDWILRSLTLLGWALCRSRRVATSDICNTRNSSSSLSTLVHQDLLLIWAVLINPQRAKQLLSTDWLNIYIYIYINIYIYKYINIYI